MSKIGCSKIDVSVLEKCTLSESGEKNCKIFCKSEKHSFEIEVPYFLSAKIEDKKLSIDFKEDAFENKRLKKINYPMWGTFVSCLKTRIIGITKGFSKNLLITGTGYRVEKKDNILVFKLGLSHGEQSKVPEGITTSIKPIDGGMILTLESHDKCLLGDYAHQICLLRQPTGYSKKGISDMSKFLVVKEVKKKK